MMSVAQTAAPPRRIELLDCPIDRVDMAGAVAFCEDVIARRGFAQHMAINAAKIVAMRRDPALRAVIEGSDLITADGMAIVWASRLLGVGLPVRVAGIDLMHELLARAAAVGWRVYVLGAREEVLAAALDRLRERYPGLVIAGARNGYFTSEEEPAVAQAIRDSRADMLFVAMSSPQKELFLGRYGAFMEVPFVMGVGGAIDIAAGVTRRAPAAMQRTGLEWLFRLLQEPRRMFRRYARTNTWLVALVARELVRRRITRRAGSPGGRT
jgi:N-acetylglucosaminyldiphosphoundecaprenol N-acetyl-beta-D-mannosaminyltransferase